MLKHLFALIPWVCVVAPLAACDDDTGSSGGADAAIDMSGDMQPTDDMQVSIDMGPEIDAGPETDLGPQTDMSPEIDMGPETDMAVPICERDDTPRRCRIDDDCGCLSHCRLGECVSDCELSADCADGERCDSFGRCRSIGAVDLVPVAPLTRGGSLRIDQHQVVRVPGVQTAIRFTVQTRPATIRLVARDGAEVQCVDETWETTCVYPDVEPDEEQAIPVRVDEDEVPEGGRPSVEVNSDGGAERIGLPSLEQAGLGGEPQPAAGTYDGVLTLALGVRERAALSPLTAPVTLHVWGDPPTRFEIVDPRHVLGERGRVIGSFDAEGRAQVPAHPFFSGALSQGAPYDIAARISVSSVVIAGGGARFRVELAFHGIRNVALTWTLAARRRGDAPARQPAVPAPVALDDALLADRRDTPTPWEAALMSALGASDDVASPVRLARGAGVAGLQTETSAGACLDQGGQQPSLAVAGLLTPFDFVAGNEVLDVQTPVADAIRLAVERNQIERGTRVRFVANPSVDAAVGAAPVPLGTIGCAGELTLSELGAANLQTESDFDRCEAIAAQTGCLIREAERNNFGNPPRIHYHVSLALDGDTRRMDAIIVRSHECLMPTPTWCAGALGCFAPEVGPDGAPGDVYDAASTAPFLADVRGRADDLACANAPDRWAGFPVDTGDPASVFSAIEVLETCVDEAGMLSAEAPAIAEPGAQAVQQVLGAETCVSAARVLAVAQVGLQAEAANDDPDQAANALEARAYALRLLTRWLTLHAFFASEATQREAFAQALRATEDVPDLLSYFDASDAGWDLLLHPRVSAPLERQNFISLLAPDYRSAVHGIETAPGDDQAQPLMVQMLVTLDQQAQVFARAMEQAALQYDDGPLERLAAYTPRALAVLALARRLYVKANVLNPNEPQFEARFFTAFQGWQSNFAGLYALADDVANGRDPLGISDADLPLYLSPDADDANASRRFAAISDFLVGRGEFRGEVTALVSRAAGALDAAREAFIAEQERDYRAALEDHDHALWVDNIRDEYNAELRDYCGPLEDNLVEDPNFVAHTCMLNPDDANCAFDDRLWYSRWTEADLLGRLCLATELPTLSLIDEDAQRFAEACYGALPDVPPTAGVLNLEACGDALCLACSGTDVEPLELSATVLELSFGGVPANDLSDPAFSEALAECQTAHPTMRRFVPVPASPLEVPGCVRGVLGQDYLDAVSAARAIESARAAMDEHLEAYDIAVQTCLIDSNLGDALIAAQEGFTNLTRGLTIGRAVAEGVAAVAGGTKDCLATAVGIDTSNPISAILDGGLTIGACVAAGVEAVATATASGLQAGIEVAERDHDLAVLRLEQGAGTEICMNDARLELVGMRGAALDLEEAAFALQRATAQVQEDIAETQRIWADGNAYINGIGARRVPPPSGELWANALVNQFDRLFRQARRGVYLAVRAVEYEFQASLGLRLEALAARDPAELEAVLDTLRADVLTGGIQGNRPAELTTVLSLRDDVLRLSDESALPAALHPLSPEERMRVYLSAERFAQYDGDGEYMGQRIPFNLAPLGAFDIETGGVPIYSTTDCAERLWSVNASILGDDVFEGSDTSFARIDLFKRNTFYSQWCGDREGASPFQVASVRPARNLFREPGTGESIGPNPLGEIREFTRARIQAFFGISQAGLEDPQYANGESTELAARGLYGDYALYIPAELISRERDGGRSDGLVLDRIDDVLLRLDYVSVAAP